MDNLPESSSKAPPSPPAPSFMKLALELGPLLLFFLANYKFGIYVATSVLMVGVVVALPLSYILTKRLPIMPLITAGAVLIFGSMTLLLHDEYFIKIKPTIVNSLLGSALLIGLGFNRPFLPIVLDNFFHLTEEGWRKLTLRWGLFFFVLAFLNEVVWRTQTNDFWVSFKVFGIMPLTFFFALFQIPLIMKYEAGNKP